MGLSIETNTRGRSCDTDGYVYAWGRGYIQVIIDVNKT